MGRKVLCGVRVASVIATSLFILISSQTVLGQTLNWATRAGGTSLDLGGSVAVDDSDNSYVTGAFVGTATFGAGEANQTMLTSVGDQDIYVAKYDNAGQLLWAKRAGAAGFDEGRAIAVDGSGNSYVTGSYRGGMATFGVGETNETTLANAGSTSEIFVAKYGSAGQLIWATRAGGTSTDVGRGMAVDVSGNVLVTGLFGGAATFGPGEANETILTSAGAADIFVALYDSASQLVWATRAGGTDFDESNHSAAIDSSGNSYVAGIFRGSAKFGPGELNETTLISSGGGDIFVARYDTVGQLIWATRAGGTGTDIGEGVVVDSLGNSYVTASFRDIATFGVGEPNETILTSAGAADIVVAKYDSAGQLIWATRAGGTGSDAGLGIGVDDFGNSYVTGSIEGSATFGLGEASEITLTSAGDGDTYVAKFDNNGQFLTASRAGGPNFEQGGDIAVNGSGNSYVAGSFVGTSTFGAGEANEISLTSAGGLDLFVYSVDSGNLAPLADAGVDQVVEATGPSGALVTLDASGSSDPDDDPLTFTWTGPFSEGGGSVTGQIAQVTLPLGTHTINLLVDDSQGGTATDFLLVQVRDTTPPVLSNVSGNITVEATSSAGAVVAYSSPTATDAVDPAPTLSCLPASGITFPLGNTVVSCTTTDASGNSANANFTVQVVDTTAPETSLTSAIDGEGANLVDGGTTLSPDMTFTFVASDAVGVTALECRLDAGAFSSCTSPNTFMGLSVGTHTFEVRGIDGSLNSDASPASLTWTILTPEEATQEVVDELESLIDGDPGSPLADKLEDAQDKLEVVLEELAKNPPDQQAALGNLEGAVGELEAAVNDGLLDSSQGNQLMDQLTEVARVLAVAAIDEAIAQGGDAGEISDAQQALAEGDMLRDSADFKDAVSKYKDALAKAESALP